jgi:hypothetical protein
MNNLQGLSVSNAALNLSTPSSYGRRTDCRRPLWQSMLPARPPGRSPRVGSTTKGKGVVVFLNAAPALQARRVYVHHPFIEGNPTWGGVANDGGAIR